MKFEILEARYVIPRMTKMFSLGEIDGLPRNIGPERDMIVLRAISSEGVEAWSAIDTVKFPIYGSESSIESWALIQELGSLFIGKEFKDAREVVRSLGYLVDHHIFKAGFANLFVDAQAIEKKVPLNKLLGGTKDRVEVGVSIPKTATLEDISQKIEVEKFKRIKIKIGPNSEDLEKIRSIRNQFPNILLMVDANSSFDFRNRAHRKMLSEYGDLDLLMIEQPLAHNDIVQHIALQSVFNSDNVPGRICLDESILTMEDLKQAIEGGIKIINIKVTRVGGLDIAKEMVDLCQSARVDTWIGGMVELTSPGKAQALALAAHAGVTLPSDISGTSAYFVKDNDPCVTPMEREKDGAYIKVPSSAGRGWEVDLEKMESITKAKKIFKIGK